MTPKHLGPGEGQIIQFLGQVRIVKGTPTENGGGYLQYESFTAPGSGASPHWHREEDETFYVLAGQYEFLIGETRFVAPTGAFVFIPRGAVHAFTNTGQDMASLLITVIPGTQHEGLLREVSELTERFEKQPDLLQQRALALKYGWVMVERTSQK